MKLNKENIPFTMVANEILCRTDISLKAKGVYAYLFSKPEGWEFAGDRIVREMKDGRKVVFAALKELETAELLKRERLPNGKMAYEIKYSHMPEKGKRVSEPFAQNGQSPKGSMTEKGSISNKDKESNKDIAEQSSAPFVFDEYLDRMENHKSRHVQVIAFYFKKKKIKFDTLQKAQSAIKRHLRAAKEVANFDDEEIVKAYRIADKEYPSIYTVETLHKILTR